MKFTVVLVVNDPKNPVLRFVFYSKAETLAFIRDNKNDFCSLYLNDSTQPVPACAFVLLFDLL